MLNVSRATNLSEQEQVESDRTADTANSTMKEAKPRGKPNQPNKPTNKQKAKKEAGRHQGRSRKIEHAAYSRCSCGHNPSPIVRQTKSWISDLVKEVEATQASNSQHIH